VSASKRKKAKRAAYAARLEELRALNITMADSGQVIQPGTPEYEKRLKHLLVSLSPEELEGLLAEVRFNTVRHG
jgi:hypothetical protein